MEMNVSDNEISEILKAYKKITVIGLSRDENKAAQRVPLYAKAKGYEIAGVHPSASEIAGIKCYQNLKDVPEDFRRFVDVFRPPEAIPEIVDQVLEAGGVEVLFLQLGITHPEAEAKAEAAGLKVISDRCLLIEINRLD